MSSAVPVGNHTERKFCHVYIAFPYQMDYRTFATDLYSFLIYHIHFICCIVESCSYLAHGAMDCSLLG